MAKATRSRCPGITVAVVLVAAGLPLQTAHAAGREEGRIFAIGDAELQRIYHDERVLPDKGHAGFGSLLFDTDGRLVLHDGTKTWLYTTAPMGETEGDWVSHAREFDVESFVSGEREEVLGLAEGDKWAVIHHAMEVDDDLYVVFYSNGTELRAAVAESPDGTFRADPDFRVGVTEEWEREGAAPENNSLESNGAYVKIEETPDELVFWEGYDSYRSDVTRGHLGWVRVRLDKNSGDVELLEKHPENPLELRPPEYIAARGGGNLSSDVRLGDQHAYFYYTRPNREVMLAAVALSPDPLFQEITFRSEFDKPLGDEVLIEKFESYMRDDVLYLIYENQLQNGEWRTGIRMYGIVE